MKRWNDLTDEEKIKYGAELKSKASSPEKYNDYYLVIHKGEAFWIYYPDVDFVDYM